MATGRFTNTIRRSLAEGLQARSFHTLRPTLTAHTREWGDQAASLTRFVVRIESLSWIASRITSTIAWTAHAPAASTQLLTW